MVNAIGEWVGDRQSRLHAEQEQPVLASLLASIGGALVMPLIQRCRILGVKLAAGLLCAQGEAEQTRSSQKVLHEEDPCRACNFDHV